MRASFTGKAFFPCAGVVGAVAVSGALFGGLTQLAEADSPTTGAEAGKLSEGNTAEEREFAQSNAGSEPLPLYWAPLVAPATLLAPGLGQHIRDGRAPMGTYTAAALSALTFVGAAAVLAASGASDGTIVPFVPLVYLGATTWTALAFSDTISTFSDPGPDGAQLMGWNPPRASPAEQDSLLWSSPGQRVSFNVLYRAVDDKAFNTTAYVESALGFDSKRWGARFSYDRSANQDIQIFEVMAAWRPFELSLQSSGGQPLDVTDAALVKERGSGWGIRVLYEREENAPGYFDKNAWTYYLHGALPLARLSPRLARIWMEQNVGFSQTFITYRGQLPASAKSDSSSAFAGQMLVNWWAWNDVGFGIGYEHGRDSTSSPASGGFTGHFFASTELRVWSATSLGLKIHQGDQHIVDLSLGVDL